MVIVGNIFEILHISEKVSQIVVRKKMDRKIVPVAISVFGYHKEKMLAMNLKPKDKIKGNLYISSRLSKGRDGSSDRYWCDIYFKEIYLVEEAPVKMQSKDIDNGLFEKKEQRVMVDMATGKVIDADTGEVIDEPAT